MLPGTMRGLPFDRRIEKLLADRDDLAPIVRPMLAAWRQLREQIAAFDKTVSALAKASPTCHLLMSVPGIEVLSVLAYVSTIEDLARFARSRSVGAYMRLQPDILMWTCPHIPINGLNWRPARVECWTIPGRVHRVATDGLVRSGQLGAIWGRLPTPRPVYS